MLAQSLRTIEPGKMVRVVRIGGAGPLKRRIMDLGITRGTELHVRKVAPLGDPIEITVRGYELSLRKADAEIIEVELMGNRLSESTDSERKAIVAMASKPDKQGKPLIIALAGNHNSGKSTLFNTLTGSNQYVGNWPGVTVEKKEGYLKESKDVIVTDLPGIYSLSPYTLEEIIARNYLVEERPDAILNIVDGTTLIRNLYLTTQLIELGIPVVVAINMIDLVRKNEVSIDIERLARELGCKVVEISALKSTGTTEAIQAAVQAASQNPPVPRHSFSGIVEHTLAHIEEALLHDMPEEQQRWYAIKLFERDKKVIEKLGLPEEEIEHIENDISRCEELLKDDSESIIASERYIYIDSIIRNCCTIKRPDSPSTSDKIDRIVTNRFAALPIFAIIMFLVYFIAVTLVGSLTMRWSDNGIPALINDFLISINCASWLQSLVLDGIVTGVGAVLGYIPQLFVLFLLLAFLEGCGYMSRIAFILDRIFRRFGLSGKSFIPILIGTGCGVPALMATRTIENINDRRMTIMTTTFIPCSAKLPVIALISGALFGGAWWVAPSAYFMGIATIACSGMILKKTRLFIGDMAPFMMELPTYQMPTLRAMLRSMWDRGWSFIKLAGTIILLATIVIWFAANFGWDETGSFGMVEMSGSILATIGTGIAGLFNPLGWGDWRSAIATITGLLGKENIVGTLAILYSFVDVSDGKASAWGLLAENYTAVAAYSFLAFNLLCAPCVAAMATIFKEMKSARWFLFAISYQCVFAYCVSLCIFQLGSLFSGGTVGVWTIIAVVLLAGFVFLLLRPALKRKVAK